jgi:hypothetical protein
VDAVRAPAVSGRFYPGAPGDLARTVRELLADVQDASPRPAPARGALVPHAGYLYSGPTAAHVFARLRVPGLVVILAPNHTGAASAPGRAALWSGGAFRTPLGDVPVDDGLASALRAASELVGEDHEAHRGEHAVEVLLPFLQVLEPAVRIVPLVLPWDAWAPCRALGEALTRVIAERGEPVLILASSDLNHYEPAAVSVHKDRAALAAFATLDGEELLARCRRERISMCGRGPAATLAAAARAMGATRADIVDYRHSGFVTGDDGAVVGYGGVVLP